MSIHLLNQQLVESQDQAIEYEEVTVSIENHDSDFVKKIEKVVLVSSQYLFSASKVAAVAALGIYSVSKNQILSCALESHQPSVASVSLLAGVSFGLLTAGVVLQCIEGVVKAISSERDERVSEKIGFKKRS